MHEIVIMNLERTVGDDAGAKRKKKKKKATRDVGDSRDWMCDIRVN